MSSDGSSRVLRVVMVQSEIMTSSQLLAAAAALRLLDGTDIERRFFASIAAAHEKYAIEKAAEAA